MNIELGYKSIKSNVEMTKFTYISYYEKKK